MVGVAGPAQAAPNGCPSVAGTNVRAHANKIILTGQPATGGLLQLCVYVNQIGTDQAPEVFYVQSIYYPGGSFVEVGDEYQVCYGAALGCGLPAYVRVYVSPNTCGTAQPLLTVETPAITISRCV